MVAWYAVVDMGFSRARNHSIKEISDVMPYHVTISSQIGVNIWISIVYSLISKSLNFIFIVIDLGALWVRILNE